MQNRSRMRAGRYRMVNSTKQRAESLWCTCITLLHIRKAQSNLECGECDCLKPNHASILNAYTKYY
jgi:hypothetical protein